VSFTVKVLSSSISVGAFIFFATRLSAQTTYPDTVSIPNPINYAPSMVGIIVKLVLSMVLIVGLIYLSMYFLKKMNSRTSGTGFTGEAIKVISRTYISPKQCLYLVKIGGKYKVLGATDSNINLISEIDVEEAAKFEKQGISNPIVTMRPGFGDLFRGMMRR
jgi:flagellar protein FliO/FliZ